MNWKVPGWLVLVVVVLVVVGAVLIARNAQSTQHRRDTNWACDFAKKSARQAHAAPPKNCP